MTFSGDLAALVLSESASLRQAMEAIDRGAAEIALVIDADYRLLGTVSDGDVRRALLGGAGLHDDVAPFVSRSPYVVGPAIGRVEVLDLMQARSVTQVPIVDDAGRLVGLHLMRNILGKEDRPNWAVIMAGGRGQRLAPLTNSVPKPMLPVAGRPILERLILHLVGQGVTRIFIAVNYLAEQIEAHFEDGAAFGCDITYLREDPHEPLGSGGALALLADAQPGPVDPVLVMNGDLITEFPVGALLDYHRRMGASATVTVQPYSHEVPFGVVDSEPTGHLAAIVEKPVLTWQINAGIYVIDPELLERIPRRIEYALPSLFADAIREGEIVAVWPLEGDWLDIGRPEELRQARGLS